jgi:cytochrome c biogenesis protein CcmG, thiol:disulfide interchange protein DsbE
MIMGGALRFLPVVAFVALGFIFWVGLFGDARTIPSALIGKPVPAFSLPAIPDLGVPGVSDADLKSGQITVVNIWASWCGPCRLEHPLLMELAKRKDIRLIGINNKDDPDNARRFLGSLGQPFAAIGADVDGRTTIDWGSYGVPETFIVDGKGIIRYKQIGGLTPENYDSVFVLEIEKAKLPLVQN